MDGDRRELQQSLLLRGIANRLEGEFGDLVTKDTLRRYVEESYAEMASRAKVLTHIPAFVERFTRQRLKAISRQRGLVSDHVPNVLFVCERNDAVSQMAAALFNALAAERACAHSAGTAPAGELLTEAVHALQEIGIDVVGEFPKPLTVEMEQAADVVVALDAHDVLPLVDGKQYRAWRLADRHEQGADGYRATREELRSKVEELIGEVVAPSVPPPHAAFDEDLASLDRELIALADAVLVQARHCVGAIEDPTTANESGRASVGDDVDSRHRAVVTLGADLIARWQPVAVDLRHLLAVSQASLHLERIGDCLLEAAALAEEASVSASPEVAEPLARMAVLVASMTKRAVEALCSGDVAAAAAVGFDRVALCQLHDGVFETLTTARYKGSDPRLLLCHDRLSRLLERGGEHAAEIAELAIELVTGERAKKPHPVVS